VKLEWKCWKAQREALQKLYQQYADIICFLGGYRSGKSTTGARWILSHALENPGTRNVAMGVNFSEAKKTTYPVLFEELGNITDDNVDPYLTGGDPEASPLVQAYNKQDKVLVLNNGGEPSSIVLGSADRPSRFEGGSFNQVWMDEAGLYQDNLWGIMDTFAERSRQQFWTTTGKGRALRTILEDRLDKDGNRIGLNIEVVKASTLDNPFISEEQKARLRRQYEGRVNEEMALRGGFGQVEGLVYPGFNRGIHASTPDFEPGQVSKWFYGYDAGWKDPRVLVEAALGPGGVLHVTDLFYRDRTQVEEAVEWLKEKDRSAPCFMFCEHSPEDIQKFRNQLGGRWVVQKADKDINSGIENVRSRLEVDETSGVPGLKVDPDNAADLVAEFNNYQEEEVGTASAEDHALDALRYLVRGVENSGNRGEVSVSGVRVGGL